MVWLADIRVLLDSPDYNKNPDRPRALVFTFETGENWDKQVLSPTSKKYRRIMNIGDRFDIMNSSFERMNW